VKLIPKQKQYTHVDYSGGHRSDPDPRPGVVIVFDGAGVHLKMFREKFVVAWDDITSFEIEGPEEAEKRVTATRMLATGLFAFALKKNESTAYVHVLCADGEFELAIPKRSASQLRDELRPFLRLLPSQPDPVVTTAASSVVPAPPGTPAGWRDDPTGRFAQRYWDGDKWSEHVTAEDGEQQVDSP
jgi:hypothetical protein